MSEDKKDIASSAPGEDLLRTLYRCMPIATITWRKQGRDFILVDFNRAAEEFTDGLIARFIGKRAGELYADRPDIRKDLARAFRDKSVIRREAPYRMFTKGEHKVIVFTFAYIPPDLVLTHLEDVTDHRRAEELLSKSEKELRALSGKLLRSGEDERKRIAVELHDGIGQSLATIKFNAENSLNLLRAGRQDEAYALLETGVPLIKRTIEEVRRIILDLRPTLIDDLGILATLSWFSREFQAIYAGITIRTGLSIRETDVPAPLKIVLYRIIQEAVNNATRHSGATRIDISLSLKGKRMELAIRDNGEGFNVEEVRSRQNHSGLGLLSMRERVETSGGAFTLKSTSKGTTVRATWPIEEGKASRNEERGFRT